MKKLLFLLFIGLVIITGCTKNTSSNIGDEITIKGINFKFDDEREFKDFIYKAPVEIEPDESKMANYLTYENKEIYDGRFVYRIVMMFQENTKLEDALKNSNVSNPSYVNYNGQKWNRYITDDDKQDAIVFVTEKNNNVYVINVLKYKEVELPLDNLSKVFMNGLKLK